LHHTTKAGFKAIDGFTNGLGQRNEGALIQEFLLGTEFVIDGISRDGVYKVVAVWEYDKRSVNGANFVYFGMKLRDTQDEEIRALLTYARTVITALKIYQGPSHMEVISCQRQVEGATQFDPCLVEVGTRCHGGEATWLPVASECIGYTQLDATLACYLRPDRFDSLPAVPKLLKSGCEAFLVSLHEGGTIKEIPGIDEIRCLESFRRCEMMIQPGNTIKATVDCFTRPGSVQMVSTSAEQLSKDYEVIRKLEKTGLFELV
jgi:hypothetical protein